MGPDAASHAATGVPAAGPARASLAAAGIADVRVAPAWRAALAQDEAGAARTAGTGASVALLALGAAGRTGAVDVVELGPDAAADASRDLGRRLRDGGGALVVADDPRCPALAAVLEGYVDRGWRHGRAVRPGPDGTSTVEVGWFAADVGAEAGAGHRPPSG
ncbi:hypothetical protein [Cellulosimicrobium sp. CUA-896]|uniref:hypothetical protein n=1 Tax=Cellulosimicrobium sp. CUA-896 TaxID=1517881 RepID=UPI00095CC261|nr:hypothetical protein [Cellulosimicrobium sp. CUA-896]OLT46797.1 hypothetical protein BJF88_04170 [Cellulosimicrobium sp. CUA-896]